MRVEEMSLEGKRGEEAREERRREEKERRAEITKQGEEWIG